jgi:hypothetical protein
VRRSLLLLIASVAVAMTAIACGAFGAGGISERANANPVSARICAHAYVRSYVRAPLRGATTLSTRVSRFRRDHPECTGVLWPRTGALPAFGLVASRAVAELIGSGDHSKVAWDPKRGLWWSANINAHWWQSALALRTLVRYLEHTGNTDPIFQHIILGTYEHNILTPHADATTNFVNKYMDDTVWWGLAWLEAAKYELRYRHDVDHAATFLRLAEWDATAVQNDPKRCGGIEWEIGYPPDTVTSAEYIALTAELYQLRSTGTFADSQLAAQWLSEARSTLDWLVTSRLVNLSAGTVFDKLNGTCSKLIGTPMTYTEGQVAEALVQLGIALHDRSYFAEANRFLKYTISPWSGLVNHGILQEACESWNGMCENSHRAYDLPSYKGIFVQAVYDWSVATGSSAYRSFLLAQAQAVLHNALSDGDRPSECRTPSGCQFGFHWALPVAPIASRIGVTAATQTSAVDALTAVLPGPTVGSEGAGDNVTLARSNSAGGGSRVL